MELRLPQEKLDKLAEVLCFFSSRRRSTRKQMQRLCGVLSHCSTLVRGGRTFTHRIIDMLRQFSAKKRYVTLSKSFHADLDWWREFAAWFNGSAKILKPKIKSTWVCTDASGSGYGATIGHDWLCGKWAEDLVMDMDKHAHCRKAPDLTIPEDINVRELYPLLEVLERWGHLWRDHKVHCITDNTQVVSAINKGKSANSVSMRILRKIFWQTVEHNCHLVGVYLAGKKNVVADALSRVKTQYDVPAFLCCRCRVET